MSNVVRVFLASLVLFAAWGCDGGDTSVSRNVTEADIKTGMDNRIKEVENNPNLTPEQKAQMIETIKGNIPGRGGQERQ